MHLEVKQKKEKMMKKNEINLFKLKILKIFQRSIGPRNNTVKLKLGSISPTFRTFWRKIALPLNPLETSFDPHICNLCQKVGEIDHMIVENRTKICHQYQK